MFTCRMCAQEMPDTARYKSRARRNERVCKKCDQARVSAISKEYGGKRFCDRDLRSKTLRDLRYRAKKIGVEYSLTLANCPEIPEVCPVLGIPIAFTKAPGRFSQLPNTPSLDRINSDLGYTPDNVLWVSRRANVIKRDATVDELVKIASFYSGLRR